VVASNFRNWHRTDMPTVLSDVRCWRQSGKHRLLESISPFDPQQTSDIAAEVESTAVPVSQRGPQVAAVAYDPLQAEWVTGKGAFVRTSLSNQAHYAGAGSIEPRRYRRPRGQANRLTGADRGRSSPCAREISPISSGGWSVNPVA
jgi:hypothetical protein